MQTVMYLKIFLGDQFQQGFFWGGEGVEVPSYWSQAKPWWDQVAKVPETPRI